MYSVYNVYNLSLAHAKYASEQVIIAEIYPDRVMLDGLASPCQGSFRSNDLLSWHYPAYYMAIY